MNAMTVLEAAPTIEAWATDMRRLIADKRNVEWQIADALEFGQAHFGEDPQMQLFLEAIGYDPKRAISDAKVARLIPPSWRTDKVSFDVCKQIAKVEDEATRQRMLKQAVDGHWNERTAHHAIVEHKMETGLLWEDDDVARGATEIVRSWNRAAPDRREYFFQLAEMAASTGFGAIDEDAAL